MTERNWTDILAHARTPDEIVRTSRDYLSTWAVEQLDRLPEDCRPEVLADAEDVAAFALALVRKQCIMGDAPRELHLMTSFFALAANRLSVMALSRRR